jgi:miniconductance mechanosensitive channel
MGLWLTLLLHGVASLNLTFFTASEPWAQAVMGLALLLALALAVHYAALLLVMPALRRVRAQAHSRLTDVILYDKALRRMAYVLPSLVVQMGVDRVPHLDAGVATVVGNVAMAFMVLQAMRALSAMLDALLHLHEQSATAHAQAVAQNVQSIKSYVQLGKLVLMVGAVIVTVATLLDRSPLIVLSGLGAMSAVLMLVFKDTILSFTAGVLLSSNDMLRLGDWIEMPQVGADGDVVDIALHTVKVQNWDKTITTIPTWRLMSESYRNWRGMSDSGGRRIKRTLRLDASSLGFLSEDEMTYLSRIELLRPYLQGKREELAQLQAQSLAEHGEQTPFAANQRRLTNIGTFRAYIEAYLVANPRIRQGMMLMVRTMEPTPEGVPIEVYCFAATTAWVAYENTQSDVFDHLLTILPEFGLRLYQNPSGNDLRVGLGQRSDAGALAPLAPPA